MLSRLDVMSGMSDGATTLWTLERDGHRVACLVRLVMYGIEVDIASNGIVALTRAFETDTEALAWAAEKRAAREARGWRDTMPEASGEHPQRPS